MCLSDLSTKNTMRFFQTLDINVEFFTMPVSEWVSQVDYTQGKQIVNHLRVVNDHAERGVKLMTDYNNQTVTKDENSSENGAKSISKINLCFKKMQKYFHY